MRIVGIDPGYGLMGWGVIDLGNDEVSENRSANSGTSHFRVMDYGVIETEPGTDFGQRLQELYEDLETIIFEFKPDYAGVEAFLETELAGVNGSETFEVDVAGEPLRLDGQRLGE